MASEISSQNKIEYPFAIKWTIAEERLAALKESDDGYLETVLFDASNIPGVKYFLRIYPNGDEEDRRGQAWISLYLLFENEKKVQAVFKFFIESANVTINESHGYLEDDHGWGETCCTTAELLDPEKKFIVDGKLVIKCEGILSTESENCTRKRKWENTALGRELWEGESKDFTIMIGGNSVQVHKSVLSDRSPVFKGMFKSEMKEVFENKMCITDFSFETVEAAIELLYDRKIPSMTVKEKTSVLQFLDKYEILNLKHSVEASLLNQISVSTVSSIANASLISNSIKLQQKCIDFIVGCSKKGICIKDLALLDTEFAMKIFENTFYTSIET